MQFGSMLHSAKQLHVHFACLVSAALCANWVIGCTSASSNSAAACTIVVISCKNTGFRRARFTSRNCFKTGQMNEGTTFLFVHHFLVLWEGKGTQTAKLEEIQQITELIEIFQSASAAF